MTENNIKELANQLIRADEERKKAWELVEEANQVYDTVVKPCWEKADKAFALAIGMHLHPGEMLNIARLLLRCDEAEQPIGYLKDCSCRRICNARLPAEGDKNDTPPTPPTG